MNIKLSKLLVLVVALILMGGAAVGVGLLAQRSNSSRVAQLKAQARNYSLLEDLNVRPRTTYLGRLRNPNPEIGNA